MGNKISLDEQLIDLRIASKQMQRSAKKCEKNQLANIEKLKKAIKEGNAEGAKIYGQNVIREKNQALNFLRLTSRIDAVASRVETAVKMNQVSGAMKNVVKGMEKGLSAMNPEEISKVMDKFEQQFEDLDVKAEYMESTMNATTATTTPAEQVDDLIAMVADENNLELGEAFAEMGPVGKKLPQQTEKVQVEADDLEARLAKLKA